MGLFDKPRWWDDEPKPEPKPDCPAYDPDECPSNCDGHCPKKRPKPKWYDEPVQLMGEVDTGYDGPYELYNGTK